MNMSFASIVNPEGAYEEFKSVLEMAKEQRNEKLRIDKWIEDNNFNDCGEPIGTIYAVNPLKTTENGTIDRYRFLTRKFPDKPWKTEEKQ